jgi:hypothetical protein
LDFSGQAIKQEIKYGIWNIKTFGVGLMIAAGTTVLTSAFVPDYKVNNVLRYSFDTNFSMAQDLLIFQGKYARF